MKRFTLAEANALIPELSRRLSAAHSELEPLFAAVREANQSLLDREWRLRQAREDGAPRIAFMELQADWDEAAAHLVACKEHYGERQDAWVRLLGRMGLVVRDLRHGLVDFPARFGQQDVCYCWSLGETEIAYWHAADHHSADERQPLTELA